MAAKRTITPKRAASEATSQSAKYMRRERKNYTSDHIVDVAIRAFIDNYLDWLLKGGDNPGRAARAKKRPGGF